MTTETTHEENEDLVAGTPVPAAPSAEDQARIIGAANLGGLEVFGIDGGRQGAIAGSPPSHVGRTRVAGRPRGAAGQATEHLALFRDHPGIDVLQRSREGRQARGHREEGARGTPGPALGTLPQHPPGEGRPHHEEHEGERRPEDRSPSPPANAMPRRTTLPVMLPVKTRSSPR